MKKFFLVPAVIFVSSLMLSTVSPAAAQSNSSKIDLNKEGIDTVAKRVPAEADAIPVHKAVKIPETEAQTPQEIIIDSVIASIDGTPITLREFEDKLVPKRHISLSDFSKDPELGKILDAMIMERLIEAEAAAKKLKVTPDDIDRYVSQVAAQNHMTKSEFEVALRQQNKSQEDFEKQARLEILRSRLMGQIAQSAPAVTDEELNESVGGDKEEEESQSSEADQTVRFKLREIVLLKIADNEEEVQGRAERVAERLEAGDDFSALAKQVSQGATAMQGGELGEVAEEDLSESVRDQVSDLEPGHYTEAIEMPDGIRFFFLDKRYEEGETSDAGNDNKEQLRKELESRKLETKFQEYFTVELPKLHKVERKVS